MIQLSPVVLALGINLYFESFRSDNPKKRRLSLVITLLGLIGSVVLFVDEYTNL